ncbi:hypothetical protein [Flagellimonas flava]|uniref:hypothetical protein n=1 Tax=Flagellimonas flava TaxID=570519 RepID=UPI003D655C96
MNINVGVYKVELRTDETYSESSSDNMNLYDKVHFETSEHKFSTKIGLKVFKNNRLINSAIIGSIGGGTGIHKNSQIIENDRMVICCSDSIFCLSIPDLELIWKTQADQATCFEIYKYNNSYIIHGELEITRVDSDGNIMWKRSGSDIFTTPTGVNDFEITEKYILATDWGNRTYKFDFDGTLVK